MTIDLTKRSFVKGLFLSAALPLVSTKSLILTPQAVSTAEIYLVESLTGDRHLISVEKLGPNLKSIINSSLVVMDNLALEQNNDYTRYRVIKGMTDLLQPLKQGRELYDYAVICDDRNNVYIKDNPTKKTMWCMLQGKYLMHYEFYVTYDPQVMV